MAYGKALSALADPTRLEVFEKLRQGPAPVGVLAKGLKVSRPAVSQHLKVLEGAGLVRARKEGTRRIYQVEVQGLVELRRYLDRFWGETLEAFKKEAERGKC
jgi:DNA-binding transcriptional ArsR family regulator